ncbi:Gfo/Idh/MocA family oxidoreductase [Pseudomonas sp. H3_H05]
MNSTPARKRVIVAGTAFGRIYLQALARARDCYELVGILSRGNAYSRACADHYGVALYETVEQVPDEVDIACVVVRSGATGGAGADLAQQFLRRGIHVLQEHPVHHREIAACMQAARQGHAAYAVNTLYPNILAIRRFLAVAAYLRDQQGLAYIEAACNSQVAYPLLDILGRLAGGLRPWSFAAPAATVGEPPSPGSMPVSTAYRSACGCRTRCTPRTRTTIRSCCIASKSVVKPGC